MLWPLFNSTIMFQTLPTTVSSNLTGCWDHGGTNRAGVATGHGHSSIFQKSWSFTYGWGKKPTKWPYQRKSPKSATGWDAGKRQGIHWCDLFSTHPFPAFPQIQTTQSVRVGEMIT
eukprot:TRINITY_DN21345_c0_g1_i1.p1 TRINITY_DN21345_c0_g1~~TRINITY_DN21345_c0_g1_i1.p1  ORF type:complete len:116 (-),score=9.91 TRINITY_DN21345_c0_g1_i1:688-1035(-)